jgi:hypothetical protein
MAIVHYLSAAYCNNKALSDSLSNTDSDVYGVIALLLKRI